MYTVDLVANKLVRSPSQAHLVSPTEELGLSSNLETDCEFKTLQMLHAEIAQILTAAKTTVSVFIISFFTNRISLVFVLS